MKTWILWLVLTRLTGSPLGSAAAIVIAWVVMDRFTFGVLPDPLRWINRWRRRSFLEHQLQMNPHDGRARLELADLYVQQGKGQKAVETLRPTFERGADDVVSVFTMGQACLQAGYVDQGEKLLAHAEELDHDFRVGEVFLVRGRDRLARKDYAGAKVALEELLRLRSGTVQGRVLLARAKRGLGDDVGAVQLEDEAWREYVNSPRFQRRKERWWAWRGRPWRPLSYLVMALLVLFLVMKFVSPRIDAWNRRMNPDDAYVDPGLDDGDDDIDQGEQDQE